MSACDCAPISFCAGAVATLASVVGSIGMSREAPSNTTIQVKVIDSSPETLASDNEGSS
jgi:hypothetical protein